MFIIVQRKNIVLIALIFLLSITLYSLNLVKGQVMPVTNDKGPQKTILLDPGHGGEDPGAVSDYSGTKEKDLNLSVALKLRELLAQEKYKVIVTRDEDRLEYDSNTINIVQKRKQDLLRRKKMMDEAGADIVVSIHMNKFPETRYFGAQTFFPPDCPESQRLAMDIQKSLKKLADSNNQRVAMLKKEPIIILKDHKTATVVVECGFLSNSEEERKIITVEYQDKLAYAIKQGINLFFEGK